MHCVKLVKNGTADLKKILNDIKVVSSAKLCPLNNSVGLHLDKGEFSLPKDTLC